MVTAYKLETIKRALILDRAAIGRAVVSARNDGFEDPSKLDLQECLTAIVGLQKESAHLAELLLGELRSLEREQALTNVRKAQKGKED